MSIVVDTSVIIDFLRRPKKEDSLLYKLAKKRLSLYCSIITHTELYSGKSILEQPEARGDLENILQGLHIVYIDVNQSIRAGNLRAQFGINMLDAIIAAVTLDRNCPLATLNEKDFRRIPELVIYRERK